MNVIQLIKLLGALYRLAEQLQLGQTLLHGVLDDLDLHADGAEDGFVQSVELVKTPPGAAFHETHKNAVH